MANRAPAPPPSTIATKLPSVSRVAATVLQLVSLANGFQRTLTTASSSAPAKRARIVQLGADGSAGVTEKSGIVGGGDRGVPTHTSGGGNAPLKLGGTVAIVAAAASNACGSASKLETSRDQWNGS